MHPRSPGAFLLSATFHVLVIGTACLFTLDSCQEKTPPKVLELVAGEGDNYGATVAPKLGTPGGLKVEVPAIPVPTPQPEPAPTPPPPEPKTETPPPQPPAQVTPAPTPPPKAKPVVKKQPDTIPNFRKQIIRRVWAADAKAKKEAAKERAAEEKRLKKEEYDRQQRAKVASAKSGYSPRIAHIDADGIAKGVIGGSSDNKEGGAGGKALVADGAVMDRYFAMLKEKVRNAIDKPPGVSDDLTVTVVVHISASGRLSGAHVVKSSGSDEFDRAVIAAFGRVTMPEHPEHKYEELELEFRTKDAED